MEGDAVEAIVGANCEIAVDEFIIILDLFFAENCLNNSCRWFIPWFIIANMANACNFIPQHILPEKKNIEKFNLSSLFTKN